MKHALLALLTIHGLVHVMGFASAWGLADFEGVSGTPTNFISTTPGSAWTKALGLVWVLAFAVFLLAAVLLMTDSGEWRYAALFAAGLSMIAVALWWENAPMGALANTLVVAAALLTPRLEGIAS